MLQGQGQPRGNARTDRAGRFSFEHVCEGTVRLFASGRNSSGNMSAEGGDTNVVLKLGQQANVAYASGGETHKLAGTVTDTDGKPASGAEARVYPGNSGGWVKTGTNGSYRLTWALEPWQARNGSALLVVRDTSRKLAASVEIPEDTTNLDVQLKPALTIAGRVEGEDGKPLAQAQLYVMIRAANNYDQINDQMFGTDAQGRFEAGSLPADGRYLVEAIAAGHGQSQRNVEPDTETNRVELEPIVLKLANHVLAGQVLNENGKPVGGANVQIFGNEQPGENTITDAKGQFHFRVCEGRVNIMASTQESGQYAYAQFAAEADDTNVMITVSSRGRVSGSPARASLQGKPLPDLAAVNLGADATPAGQAVLVVLFDAGQRSSRHVLHQLDQQKDALRQKNISLVAVQSTVTSDEVFNEWKSSSAVTFPVGRVSEQSPKNRWATGAAELPWLILADASHKVVAEGFSADDLEAQIQKLSK
jgi:hypothetical protein